MKRITIPNIRSLDQVPKNVLFVITLESKKSHSVKSLTPPMETPNHPIETPGASKTDGFNTPWHPKDF